MTNLYNKLFASRSFLSFLMVMTLFLSCVLRVSVIMAKDYRQIQENQSLYKISISKPRGTIYDCNMVPITNNKTKVVAAVLPVSSAIAAVNKSANEEQLKNLQNKIPDVCVVEKPINASGITTTTVYETETKNLPACHIIGYSNDTGHGITGLELAYDEILYSDKEISAVFTTDGKGKVLCGIEPYFENNSTIANDGVVTTININFQAVVEKALLKINSGCAIVADASNGKIRAIASAPKFDLDNIYASLNNDTSPLINRALSTYSVGSVFKPCIAALTVENGLKNNTFNCLGGLEIENRIFKCHKIEGHGQIDLASSLAQSCNCYFYNTAIMLGAENLYRMAESLNVCERIRLADNLYTSSGKIPKTDSLNTKSALANFGIGQGTLITSPVAMLNLYQSIAGDGSYYLPSLVEKTIKNGKSNDYDIGYKTRVMKSDTAKELREHLKKVITDGTGSDASPNLCTAAGKTATAQTGRYYDDGIEITNSWFCGFFPAEKPQYIVVVMCDRKSDVSTASVFAEIADGITELANCS